MKIVIIVSILAIAFIIFAIWSKSRGAEIKSFWDVVRNPGSMPDLNEFHKHVGDSASSISGSALDVARLVDYFVFEAKSSRDAQTEKRIIAKLGKEAYPRALEILRDTSVHDKLVELTEAKDSLPETPICRLCEIFDQDTPPPLEVANLLAPFLGSTDKEVRKNVALILGSTGSVASLPEIQRALKDQDGYVKSYALMGIQRALSGGRITPASESRFFEAVAGMWPEDTSFSVCKSIPKILLNLDRDRAVERLLRPDLFTAKFKSVWAILEAFAEERVEVPRARLLALIEETNKEPIEYPMDNVLEETLSLLGRHRVQEDLPTLERMVDHPNEQVSRGAIKGLYSHHQYFSVIRNPRTVIETDGWNTLTIAEKHICAIEELDAEVNNGGFAQYYFNSSGNRWQEALSGLAAIGAHKRHDILAATIKKFGRTTPSSVRDTRNSQLSNVVRKQEDPFSDQDTAWYKIEGESLDRLMFRYNLANTEGRKKVEPISAEQPASRSEPK